MATAKIPGGLYQGVDGHYHDANGEPISDEAAHAVLGTAVPEPKSTAAESTETPAPVLPEAPKLKGKKGLSMKPVSVLRRRQG